MRCCLKLILNDVIVVILDGYGRAELKPYRHHQPMIYPAYSFLIFARVMPRNWHGAMLKLLSIVILVTFTRTVAAVGVEETFLVLQTESGALLSLDYWSSGEDEQQGISRYVKYDQDKKTSTTRCSYKNNDAPRKMACTLIEGKRVNRLYVEQPASAGNNASQAKKIYNRFVGNRLPSSVGEMHEEVFACVAGCPSRQTPVVIKITCAECGMEEDWCDRRFESKPKRAFVKVDGAVLRTSPDTKGKIAGKLRNSQVLRITEAKPACSEVRTEDDVRVGRWIKVSTDDAMRKNVGWIFDIDVRYENEP